MSELIADIFVTIKPEAKRIDLTKKSLASLRDNTDKSQYRLTLCFDGQGEANAISEIKNSISADYILESYQNEGLGPTINRAIAHIKTVNDWYSHPSYGDHTKVAPYIVMCQDDLLYSKDWLQTLAYRFRAYGLQYKLGFASGIESIEHAEKTRHKKLADGIYLQDWIRAAQMLATREYWESMMPISRFDPETGRVRAKPNDGIGSGVDWWLIRNHPNSVCKTGKTCLVMPGLCQHAGYNKSTWLQNGREMPESEADKEKIGCDL